MSGCSNIGWKCSLRRDKRVSQCTNNLDICWTQSMNWIGLIKRRPQFGTWARKRNLVTVEKKKKNHLCQASSLGFSNHTYWCRSTWKIKVKWSKRRNSSVTRWLRGKCTSAKTEFQNLEKAKTNLSKVRNQNQQNQWENAKHAFDYHLHNQRLNWLIVALLAIRFIWINVKVSFY